MLGIFDELVYVFGVIHTNIHCNSHAAVNDRVVSHMQNYVVM